MSLYLSNLLKIWLGLAKLKCVGVITLRMEWFLLVKCEGRCCWQRRNDEDVSSRKKCLDLHANENIVDILLRDNVEKVDIFKYGVKKFFFLYVSIASIFELLCI